MIYIYFIENNLDSKVFIGQTCNIDQTWYRLMSCVNYKHYYFNRPLVQDMIELGVNNFHMKTVQAFTTKREANNAKKTLIRAFLQNNIEIYNIGFKTIDKRFNDYFSFENDHEDCNYYDNIDDYDG